MVKSCLRKLLMPLLMTVSGRPVLWVLLVSPGATMSPWKMHSPFPVCTHQPHQPPPHRASYTCNS